MAAAEVEMSVDPSQSRKTCLVKQCNKCCCTNHEKSSDRDVFFTCGSWHACAHKCFISRTVLLADMCLWYVSLLACTLTDMQTHIAFYEILSRDVLNRPFHSKPSLELTNDKWNIITTLSRFSCTFWKTLQNHRILFKKRSMYQNILKYTPCTNHNILYWLHLAVLEQFSHQWYKSSIVCCLQIFKGESGLICIDWKLGNQAVKGFNTWEITWWLSWWSWHWSGQDPSFVNDRQEAAMHAFCHPRSLWVG